MRVPARRPAARPFTAVTQSRDDTDRSSSGRDGAGLVEDDGVDEPVRLQHLGPLIRMNTHVGPRDPCPPDARWGWRDRARTAGDDQNGTAAVKARVVSPVSASQ